MARKKVEKTVGETEQVPVFPTEIYVTRQNRNDEGGYLISNLTLADVDDVENNHEVAVYKRVKVGNVVRRQSIKFKEA